MAGSTTLRLTDQLKAEALAYAEPLGLSLNALCAVALRDYLDSRKQQAAQSTPPAVPERPAVPVAVAKVAVVPKVGANQPCPCGSGQKYKRCHGKP